MWFFIVEGYHYTHDVKKYAARLFALALISHLRMISASASRLCRCPPGRSIRRASCGRSRGGLVLLVIHDDARLKDWVKIALTFVICAITFPSDWSCIAAMAMPVSWDSAGRFSPSDVLAHGVVGRVCALCTFSSLIRCTRSCSSVQRSPSRCCGVMTAHAQMALYGQALLRLLSRAPRAHRRACACCSGARGASTAAAASDGFVMRRTHRGPITALLMGSCRDCRERKMDHEKGQIAICPFSLSKQPDFYRSKSAKC